jgi:cytochrome c oxidase subunit 3
MKLEVGAAETIVEKEKLKKRSILSNGAGSGGNKNRGGGGGGGSDDGDNNNPGNKNFEDIEEQFKPDKFRVVTWSLLLVVVMTFGGLISAYVVIATNGAAEWKPVDLPIQIWVSTVLILLSSISYQISNTKLRNNDQKSAKKWLLVTTILGAAFISSQILAWLELVYHRDYVQSSQYAGFFYILTGVHAVHVLGGIAAIGYIVLRTWNQTRSEMEMLQRKTVSNVVGWYWHFMDALWIILFLLLGYWK